MAWEARYVAQRPNLAVGLLAFFGLIFCLALRAGWFLTFSPLLQVMARIFDVGIPLGFKTVHPFGFLADAFRKLDNTIAALWGKGIAVTGHAFIELALWVAYQLTMIGVAIAAIGYELAVQGAHLIARTSVTYVRPIVKKVTHVTEQTVTRVKVVADSRVPALAREVKALEAQIAHVAEAVALPAPITVPRELPRIGDLRRAWEWTKARLDSLRKLGTVAGIIGLTTAALARLGLGWIRCSRVSKVGKQVCGLNEGLLDGLLADLLLVVGAVSVVEFAEALLEVEGEVVSGLERFVREL